jgi:DNA-binding CsgD family transcriptional regulator
MAERHGDEDLLTLALHMRGRARLRAGQVADGLPLLDEAMIAVISDRLTPHVAGILYCSVIAACREVWALDRARQWTDALTVWCERQPEMVPYSGECRVFRAEILQREGAWRAAIEEAGRALDRAAEPLGRGTKGPALYEQAEAHRLLGELAAAEETYRKASAAGYEPQPGLALLRLAQGEPDVARAALERALTESARHRRARLLPAYVEVLMASGDLDGARAACEELAELAKAWQSGPLATTVTSCRGAIELAAGKPREALPLLRRAWEEWSALSSPYEAARTQGLLGLACRRLGDEDGARLALGAARATLESLGAATALARLDAAWRGSDAADDHGLTPREREVLAQVATGRTNRAIAEALFISEKTVARHVANIFAKLGLSSRAAATAYAYEHGLHDPSA